MVRAALGSLSGIARRIDELQGRVERQLIAIDGHEVEASQRASSFELHCVEEAVLANDAEPAAPTRNA